MRSITIKISEVFFEKVLGSLWIKTKTMEQSNLYITQNMGSIFFVIGISRFLTKILGSL